MRISYVTETYPPELNGVALTVKRTVEYLRARGHDVELIRPRQPGESQRDRPDEWRTRGCPIPRYPELRFGLAWPATLRRRFQAARPQLVHIATQGPLGFAAARAARQCGIPLTMDFRTNFHQYGQFYGIGALTSTIVAYLRRFHDAAQVTFVPTAELKHVLEQQGFQRLQVVGRGVDTSRFDPALRNAALREAWGAADDSPVLLYVGRLAAEKNVPLLMDSWAAARQARPDARLVIVGDGPLRRELQERHGDACFLGALRGQELARVYASADIFVFPSLSETFGNVVIEALASELVVVAYRAAAAGELIANGESGVVVEPGNAGAYVEAVREVVLRFQGERGDSGWDRMRRQARSVAVATDWESVLARFERQLELVADEDKNVDDAGSASLVHPV